MKKLLLILAIPAILFSEEGYMCGFYYKAVARKVNNINSLGNSLSDIARARLYRDLKFEVTECISNCEGQKFKYCNEISKKVR